MQSGDFGQQQEALLRRRMGMLAGAGAWVLWLTAVVPFAWELRALLAIESVAIIPNLISNGALLILLGWMGFQQVNGWRFAAACIAGLSMAGFLGTVYLLIVYDPEYLPIGALVYAGALVIAAVLCATRNNGWKTLAAALLLMLIPASSYFARGVWSLRDEAKTVLRSDKEAYQLRMLARGPNVAAVMAHPLPGTAGEATVLQLAQDGKVIETVIPANARMLWETLILASEDLGGNVRVQSLTSLGVPTRNLRIDPAGEIMDDGPPFHYPEARIDIHPYTPPLDPTGRFEAGRYSARDTEFSPLKEYLLLKERETGREHHFERAVITGGAFWNGNHVGDMIRDHEDPKLRKDLLFWRIDLKTMEMTTKTVELAELKNVDMNWWMPGGFGARHVRAQAETGEESYLVYPETEEVRKLPAIPAGAYTDSLTFIGRDALLRTWAGPDGGAYEIVRDFEVAHSFPWKRNIGPQPISVSPNMRYIVLEWIPTSEEYHLTPHHFLLHDVETGKRSRLWIRSGGSAFHGRLGWSHDNRYIYLLEPETKVAPGNWLMPRVNGFTLRRLEVGR